MPHKEQCEQLILLTKDIFPEHAEIETYDDVMRMSCMCRICWKVDDDKSRSNKRSQPIIVVISHEALDDYTQSTENKQDKAQERFKQFIQKKFNTLYPDQGVPGSQEQPGYEWLVTTELLNG